MRSRLFPCVALAAFAFIAARAPSAHAADPKAKSAKKKGDDLSEDKSGIGKTLQWEDKVMGPDDKGPSSTRSGRRRRSTRPPPRRRQRDKAATPRARPRKKRPRRPDDDDQAWRRRRAADAARRGTGRGQG